MQYYNSLILPIIPAPYAFFLLFLSKHIPNSTVNQYIAAILFNSTSEAPRDARPIS
jgi:hypothetical protein